MVPPICLGLVTFHLTLTLTLRASFLLLVVLLVALGRQRAGRLGGHTLYLAIVAMVTCRREQKEKIAFQSKADHPACIYFVTLVWPCTLTLTP